jgi:hypothetical protein
VAWKLEQPRRTSGDGVACGNWFILFRLTWEAAASVKWTMTAMASTTTTTALEKDFHIENSTLSCCVWKLGTTI